MGSEKTDRWFLEVIMPLEPALVAFLRRRWNNPSDVPDLRQEVLIRAYQAAQTEIPAKPKSLLFTIAKNLLIDRIRRNAIVPIDTVSDLEKLNVITGEPDPERQLSAREELRVLEQALRRLSPRRREAVILRKVEGLSQKETAARMGIGEKALEQQVSKGIRELREALLEIDVVFPGRRADLFLKHRVKHDKQE